MKNMIRKSGIGALLAFLVAVLAVGCDDRSKTSADSSVASARVTGPTLSNAVMHDADNTARNARDRNDATLTPGDQGNTPADREITQKIRKALVGAKDYSVTAQNIKIITVDGKVTLRGPVKSETEKTGIVALAKTVAGGSTVDDQLEVKTNP